MPALPERKTNITGTNTCIYTRFQLSTVPILRGKSTHHNLSDKNSMDVGMHPYEELYTRCCKMQGHWFLWSTQKIQKKSWNGQAQIIMVMIIIKYIGKNQQYAHQVSHANGTLPYHTHTHTQVNTTHTISLGRLLRRSQQTHGTEWRGDASNASSWAHLLCLFCCLLLIPHCKLYHTLLYISVRTNPPHNTRQGAIRPHLHCSLILTVQQMFRIRYHDEFAWQETACPHALWCIAGPNQQRPLQPCGGHGRLKTLQELGTKF